VEAAGVKVVATQGPLVWLIDVGQGRARVADFRRKMLFAPFNMQSILARGGWREPEDQSALDRLAELQEVDLRGQRIRPDEAS
jgi:hypothetical protein